MLYFLINLIYIDVNLEENDPARFKQLKKISQNLLDSKAIIDSKIHTDNTTKDIN